MTDDNSAVADLRSKWHTLCDLDRARAVQALHQAGISLRKLAGQLDCSQSLLSRLLRALEAPPEDLERARQVPISIRELARRADPANTRSTSRQHEAISFELERAAVQGSQTILSWLDEEDVAVEERKQVVGLARVHLAKTDEAPENERDQILQNMFLDEADRQARLGQTVTDRYHSIPWSALRLALWIFRRIPDLEVRAKSFELARGELSIYRTGRA